MPLMTLQEWAARAPGAGPTRTRGSQWPSEGGERVLLLPELAALATPATQASLGVAEGAGQEEAAMGCLSWSPVW
jgi:hypothetical protein